MEAQVDQSWILTNFINSRLNFRWLPSDNISINAAQRTLFTYGGFVEQISGYNKLVTVDDDYFDLTHTISSGPSYLLYSGFDRANIGISAGKFDIKAGRQRVNWRVNLIWNPNDIFNTSSYFDFSYLEKPG